MDRWQTTVRGSTYKEIVDAARIAVFSFFDRPNQLKAMQGLRLNIIPAEIVTIRGGRGEVVDERIDSYEATVTVEL